MKNNEDENKVIIESSQIEYVCLLDDINGMVLNMKLTADGTDKFADYTKNNIGSAVRFVINGKTVSNPYINNFQSSDLCRGIFMFIYHWQYLLMKLYSKCLTLYI